MDLTIPIEGASGGVATLILYGLIQLVRSKLNGGRNNRLPCELHAQRLVALEMTIEHLTGSQNAAYAASRMAENAAVVVMNEHGERIASLEATATNTASGVMEIKVMLRDIEAVLRNQKRA